MSEDPGFTSENIKAAVTWALDLHAEQHRKGTSIPYAAHILGVASLVLEDGGDEEEFIAALLHDASEDAGLSNDAIAQRFGPRVARIVATATDTLPDGRRGRETWRERKTRYLAHLKTMADDERRVALADKLHNARALLRDIGPSATPFGRATARIRRLSRVADVVRSACRRARASLTAPAVARAAMSRATLYRPGRSGHRGRPTRHPSSWSESGTEISLRS